jgi:hypothetical protein
MADDWAIGAAKKAAEQDQTIKLNLEKNARDAEIKNVAGAAIFKRLEEWIGQQIKQFNSLRGHEDITIESTAVPRLGSQSELDTQIRLRRSNGQPVIITYNPIPHTIICAGGRETQVDFVLTIVEGTTAIFENSYHQPKSPEEMGAAILDRLMKIAS